MPFRVILCLVMGVSLLSCATVNREPSDVSVADGVFLTLTPPPTSLNGRSWSWRLQLIAPDETKKTVLAQMRITDDTLNVVMMTPSGLPLISIEKQGQKAIFAQYYLPNPPVDAEAILADIQLAHWPVNRLNGALVGGALVDNSTQTQRVLTNNQDEVVLVIERHERSWRIEHRERDYHIQLMELEP